MAKKIEEEAEEKEESEDEETSEIDVTEIFLAEDEIDRWIGQLVELKETKEETTFVLDDQNELIIKYEEIEDEEDEEEDSSEETETEDEEEDKEDEEEEAVEEEV
jgi:hypothetical protein